MQLRWRRSEGKCRFTELPIEKHSYQVKISGAGAEEFKSIYDSYKSKEEFKTSRAVYQTFCDTLNGIKEKTIGGAPQLVGLYRKKESPGYMFGIIHNKQLFFNGMHIDNYKKVGFENIEWRNEMFERCDGMHLSIVKGAKRQPHI